MRPNGLLGWINHGQGIGLSWLSCGVLYYNVQERALDALKGPLKGPLKGLSHVGIYGRRRPPSSGTR